MDKTEILDTLVVFNANNTILLNSINSMIDDRTVTKEELHNFLIAVSYNVIDSKEKMDKIIAEI